MLDVDVDVDVIRSACGDTSGHHDIHSISALGGPGANPHRLDECREHGRRLPPIRDAGFAAVDDGPLRIARYSEPFALLVGQIAYGAQEGQEVAYHFDWLRD